MLNPYVNNGFNMPYNANISPYNGFNSTGQQLVRVSGLDGAKAYNMTPNSTAALFDNNEDILYIKSTDGAGFPTIRTFTFSEVKNNINADNSNNYVTRKELEEYVKHIVSGNTDEHSTD